ncbi:MAG: thiamine pyrophosphate-binding protein, partial [Acetobacteraceae bacterium]
VYTLPGSHVKAICAELARAGIRIVSARHECAAVHMAHAEADLTGRIGVAVVTTGPGLTNAITGIASAYLARTPLLVLSARVPDPQAGMGALEEVPQGALVRPICRYVREISDGRHVLPALHMATTAAIGGDGPPGPAYLDFDPSLLKQPIAAGHLDQRWLSAVTRPRRLPDREVIDSAVELLRDSRRTLVIGGHAARGMEPLLDRFLRTYGCVYLDTRESKGALPPDSPCSIPALRGRAIAEADLVVTLGRRLDFELAYGSGAVFSPSARFLRVGRATEELSENRRGDVEICADVESALSALLDRSPAPKASGLEWRDELIRVNAEKTARMTAAPATPPVGANGRMHPFALIDAINRLVNKDTICIVDGGDILSFARVRLQAHTYLDLGPFGCLGSGVPYGVAASLAFPSRRSIALIGDGAFGFSALEIETAVRNRARALFVVANNDAWNIERHDQLAKYPGQDLGGDLSGCRYDRLAQSLGAYGERVEEVATLDGALERGLANLPAVIDVAVRRDVVSADGKAGLADVPPLHALPAWDEAERLAISRHPS